MKTLEELMMTKLLPEIMDEVAACATGEEIIKVILKNQSPALKMMFQYTFYPNVQFSVTKLPKFRPDAAPIGLSPNSLFLEMRRLYVFLETKDLPLKKKEQLLAEMCESIHPTEVELLGRIINRDLKIPLLTYELVQEIFPGILP